MSHNYLDLSGQENYIDLSENYVNLSHTRLTSRWQLEALTHQKQENTTIVMMLFFRTSGQNDQTSGQNDLTSGQNDQISGQK